LPVAVEVVALTQEAAQGAEAEVVVLEHYLRSLYLRQAIL
tara:strand:+ start:411 stop:530 length:120 start_codon:yes stop_codon:yes gene_type:complete